MIFEEREVFGASVLIVEKLTSPRYKLSPSGPVSLVVCVSCWFIVVAYIGRK